MRFKLERAGIPLPRARSCHSRQSGCSENTDLAMPQRPQLPPHNLAGAKSDPDIGIGAVGSFESVQDRFRPGIPFTVARGAQSKNNATAGPGVVKVTAVVATIRGVPYMSPCESSVTEPTGSSPSDSPVKRYKSSLPIRCLITLIRRLSRSRALASSAAPVGCPIQIAGRIKNKSHLPGQRRPNRLGMCTAV